MRKQTGLALQCIEQLSFITKWIIWHLYFPNSSSELWDQEQARVLLSVTSSWVKMCLRPDHQIKPTLSNPLGLWPAASSLKLSQQQCPFTTGPWALSQQPSESLWFPYITLNSAEAAVSDHLREDAVDTYALSSKDVFHHALRWTPTGTVSRSWSTKISKYRKCS